MKYENNLRNIREKYNLTQREVSQLINMSQRNYSYYENGERNIPAEILIKLADIFGVSIDYILKHKVKEAKNDFLSPTLEKSKKKKN